MVPKQKAVPRTTGNTTTTTTTAAAGQNNTGRPSIVHGSSDDEDEFIRTRILLLGLRRSGKTSIQQVLFNNLNPKQAFFVEPTIRLTKHKVNSFIPLEIWDCPGTVTPDTLGAPLSSFTTIIFVVDIQDSYHHAVARLIDFGVAAYQECPDVNLEVFVHKAEALSDEFRFENFRHIQQRVLDELADLPPLSFAQAPSSSSSANGAPASPTLPSDEAVQVPFNFYLTSVYDHTLHEAFSRVFARIMAPGSLPYLEGLLNSFTSSSSSSKTFLFDVCAGFYVATDYSPVDTAKFGLCCDYVRMLSQFEGLYKSQVASPADHPRRRAPPEPPTPTALEDTVLETRAKSRASQSTSPKSGSAGGSRATTPTHTGVGVHAPMSGSGPSSGTTSPPLQRGMTTTSTSSPGPLPAGTTGDGVKTASTSAATSVSTPAPASSGKPKKALFYPSSSTSLSAYYTLVYHVITPRLALLAMLPTTVWEGKRGLVEYNIVYFREGVQEIYDVEQDSRRRKKVASVDAQAQEKKSGNRK